MSDTGLINQVFEIGKTHLQADFVNKYGDLFDSTIIDRSGLGKPEVYEPLIIESRRKVLCFSLPSTLIYEGAVNARIAGMPDEISDYIHALSPRAIGTSLISWIDPKLPFTVQQTLAEYMQEHMMSVFEHSPAEIILNAPLNYNPKGATLSKALHAKNGHYAFLESDDAFYSDIERKIESFHMGNSVRKDELLIPARARVTLKGLTMASQAKIEKFEQRYGLDGHSKRLADTVV